MKPFLGKFEYNTTENWSYYVKPNCDYVCVRNKIKRKNHKMKTTL